jgi:RimJ/RimL family protein N-acetyltransferase
MGLEAPDLRDDVIALRLPEERDVDAIVDACQDPEIPRYTRVPSPYRREHAETFLENNRKAWSASDDTTELSFVVTERGADRVLGAIGLKRFPARGAAEVGYWLAADARGNGHISRAVRLVARWALVDLGFARLELFTEPDNAPSQRVAERCGFTREGVLRSYLELKDRRSDVVMFSLLPEDLG